MKKIVSFLQKNYDKNWHAIIPILNIILIAISIWLNITYNGGFCVFVPWAMMVQIICFVNMVTFTWMEKTSLWWFNAFICGISTGVFFYWVIFSGILVILFPVSILFIFLLVWRNVKHPVRKQSRPWYFAGITVCVVFAIVSAILFSTAAKKIRRGEYNTKNPMTERILGMHFRYHTRICIFDGWRPPLHDPAMVIGMRLTGDKDPLEGMTLESRLLLYHEVYPSLPVKNHCACSLESAENGYFEDYLWKALDFKPMKVMKRVPVYRCVEYAESNNERLKDAGLPFSFISTEFNQIVVNLEDGSDTITSGSSGSYFDEISLVEFEGQPMYRLTCELIRDPIKNKVMHWEVFILPNGIQFATDSFNTHGEYTYWLASNSIDIMDSIEIFYPMIDVRDTVKIYRIESQ
jgi:hypothetical protein